MKKCIIIPDSFKGTMSSMEVCEIMARSVKNRFEDCCVMEIPVADGGEGTVDCFLRAREGEKIYALVNDAYGHEMKGFYARFGKTAVIEMAAVAGMVSNSRRDTLNASTYGVGQLIDHAILAGAEKVVIGLGGSCTSDAGCGMAAALGMRFLDSKGNEFVPVGKDLDRIATIDDRNIKEKLEGIEICCMCDTNKVMYGADGAAHIYAPQKGANPNEVILLDDNLKKLAKLIEDQLEVDVSRIAGGGAAGAMGAGATAFMNADLKPGIEYIMDIVGFEEKLEGADCVFTGEGSFDTQSLSGKAVCGIASRAAVHHVPVIVVAGRNRSGSHDLKDYGIAAVYETAETEDFEEIRKTCREDLASTMDTVLGDIEAILSSFNNN